MDDRKIKFRSAMGGYNKDDVNSYIEMMNSRFFEAENNSRKTIAELERMLKVLKEEKQQKEVAEMTELEAAKKASEQRELLIVELNGAIEKLNNEKEELTKENAELRLNIAEYENMTEVNSEVYEKSSKFDKVSEQIGSMIVSAGARAESIVSEAEMKARVTSNTMIDSTVEKLNAMNEKYASEIMTKTIQLTDELRALSLAAESFRTETKNAIESDCVKIKEYLESTKRIIVEDNNE